MSSGHTAASSPVNVITPIKPLPNGHFLVVLTVSSGPTDHCPLNGQRCARDRFDRQHNSRSADVLAESIFGGERISGPESLQFSRDILALPNGHYVFLAQMAKEVSNITGYPGTTNVAGDVLVDVDQNYKPDWVWNSFAHLDVNRHPFQFPPDWTHSDALLYSTDDHDLLLSVRNQNWVIKIDYQDATGTGNIVWRLGEGGDFKLVGGVDPTDWFYAQHGMNFFSQIPAVCFSWGYSMTAMIGSFPRASLAAPPGPGVSLLYCSVLSVDESAMTATLLHHYVAPAHLYSFFGGQADLLPNGDIEVDFGSPQSGATVQEYQPGSTVVETSPQIVWQAVSPGYDQYRALRLQSVPGYNGNAAMAALKAESDLDREILNGTG
jgi:hypothetical protein